MLSFPQPKLHDACLALLQIASAELLSFQRHPAMGVPLIGNMLPTYTTTFVANLIFLLDSRQTILSLSGEYPHILGYDTSNLTSHHFESLLAPESYGPWMNLQNKLSHNRQLPVTASLTLLSRERLLLPSLCTFFRVPGTDTILVSVNAIHYRNEVSEKSVRLPKGKHQAAYEQLIHYIRTNLDTPLPSTRKLALLLHTNECTLKSILREHYGTTLHTLCREERLKRSRELALESTESLKKIAMDCGFVSYSHFSRAFKKRFGISPRDMQQRSSRE